MRSDGKIGVSGGLDTDGGRRPLSASDRVGRCKLDREYAARPKPTRRTYVKMIGVFFVCAIAVAVVASVVQIQADDDLEQTAKTAAPGPPQLVIGFTYATGGGIVPNCVITITNLRTSDVNTTTSDADYGYYSFDMQNSMDNGWLTGDPIRIEAVDAGGTIYGMNESVTTGAGGYDMISVTLDTAIPEFPMAILPIVGMVAIVAVASLIRRRGSM